MGNSSEILSQNLRNMEMDSGFMKKETEGLLLAGEEQALRTN